MTTKRDKNGKAYPAYHVRLKAEQDRKAEIQRNNELIRMLPVVCFEQIQYGRSV